MSCPWPHLSPNSPDVLYSLVETGAYSCPRVVPTMYSKEMGKRWVLGSTARGEVVQVRSAFVPRIPALASREQLLARPFLSVENWYKRRSQQPLDV